MADQVDPLGSVTRSLLQFFWLADASGSMGSQGKIEALNNAIHEALPAVRDANAANAFADMAIRAIAFARGAWWHVPQLTPIDDFSWHDLEAGGVTDLGAAIRLLSEELTPEKMGRRALPPVIVLLSDGAPTDNWEAELDRFNQTGWGRPGRTVRVGIAIGRDAQKDVLTRFTGSADNVFEADNAQRLTELIKWASVTVSRFASQGASTVDASPGEVSVLPPPPAVPVEDGSDDTW